MDHQANPGEKLADNPKRIWLAPRCMLDERTWCEDDIGCCDECGEPTVEYVRRDIAMAAVDAERERCAKICDEGVTKHTGEAQAVLMATSDLIREPVE